MITRDEWLSAFKAAEPANDPDALTRQELCALLGLSKSATNVRIAKLVAGGRARVTRKRMLDTSGRTQLVVAYHLVKEKDRPCVKPPRVTPTRSTART